MIICPNCKEEIDDDSYFCDQCGQALLFCNRCGRVGMGRRCTFCGGLMMSAESFHNEGTSLTALSSSSTSMGFISKTQATLEQPVPGMQVPQGVPVLTLYNDSLNIRFVGINGAVIGRRQGPYTKFFEQNMFVSGVHAQLKYKAGTGWCIADKHSSNGTKLNGHPLQPDMEMTINNGDVLTVANVNLQVSLN